MRCYSRICAVWGGGQILGRSILPLHFIDYQEPAEPILSPAPSSAVTVSRITATSLSTPQSTRTTSTSQRLALAVALDPAPAKPEVFTADWIIASQSHLDLIHPPSFPIPTSVEALEKVVHSVSAIVILTSAVSFPPTISSAKATPTSEEEATIEAAERKAETPDSNVFIFPAGQFEDLLGTVTVLQVGAQTFACPEGYRTFGSLSRIIAGCSPTVRGDRCFVLHRPHLDSLDRINHSISRDTTNTLCRCSCYSEYNAPIIHLVPLDCTYQPSAFSPLGAQQQHPHCTNTTIHWHYSDICQYDRRGGRTGGRIVLGDRQPEQCYRDCRRRDRVLCERHYEFRRRGLSLRLHHG